MFKFNVVKNDYDSTIKLSKELIEKLYLKGWILEESNPNFVFVIGGDGTFLKAVAKYQNQLQKTKFIPFKLGGIGFYTNKNRVDDFEQILEMIEEETYSIYEYEVLEIKNGQNRFYATNEIKILNERTALYIDIFINNDYLETFHGTGLVISTSNGSTGYIKSTGGAVILPKNQMLYQLQELVPISTNKFRTLNSPIILNNSYKLNLKLESINELLICDTQVIKLIDKQISIKVSDIKVSVISHQCEKEQSEIKVLRDIFIKDKEKVI